MSAPTRTTGRGALSPVTVGILFAIGASLSFSGAGFVASQLVDVAPGTVIALYEAIFGLLFVVGLHMRDLRAASRSPRSGLYWAALAGVGIAGGTASFYTALGHIPFSVAAPIIGTVPLVSYALVLVLLRGHERITRRAALGACMVIAGVVAIRLVNA